MLTLLLELQYSTSIEILKSKQKSKHFCTERLISDVYALLICLYFSFILLHFSTKRLIFGIYVSLVSLSFYHSDHVKQI